MRLEIDTELLNNAVDAQRVASAAVEKARRELDALNQWVAENLPLQGLGRNALVEHKHADAHYGIPRDKQVRSRVVNAYCEPTNGALMLRIQLGSTVEIGKFTSGYASVRAGLCTVHTPSNTHYF